MRWNKQRRLRIAELERFEDWANLPITPFFINPGGAEGAPESISSEETSRFFPFSEWKRRTFSLFMHVTAKSCVPFPITLPTAMRRGLAHPGNAKGDPGIG
jgi:hypothetical protein